MILPYDKTDPLSIEKYAKELIGLTFYDVLKNYFDNDQLLMEKVDYFNKDKGKGTLGNLIEEYYFFYKPNNDSRPDFSEANAELKVTPYEITKSNKLRAGERLVISMISNAEPVIDDFYSSHLITKLQLILFILYLRVRENKKVDYQINYVSLFSILSEESQNDLKIIIDDYKKIITKIKEGRAHELSEGDTKYLGACTKGQTATKSLQKQYYSDIPAKRRAFSLKQSYMTYLINHYILGNVKTYNSIFHKEDNIDDFEDLILNKIKKYRFKTEKELYDLFKINPKSKRANNSVIMRMLGVNTENAEEFEKANIVPKTIRINRNGMPKEHMSFPTFKIKEFIQEDFELSEVYNLFSQTKFLFVVFSENKLGDFILQGAKFWNMPISELENQGYKEWLMFKNKFTNGINFKLKNGKIYNDIPNASETEIFHIRLHSPQTAYIINGEYFGKGKNSDMDELPNGDKMTKQCFWLNKEYIKKQIAEIID